MYAACSTGIAKWRSREGEHGRATRGDLQGAQVRGLCIENPDLGSSGRVRGDRSAMTVRRDADCLANYSTSRAVLHKSGWDSSSESKVVAAWHEQMDTRDLQSHELAGL